MSRTQREKSQARASEKHSGKWIGSGSKGDSEKSMERRRKRSVYSQSRYIERYNDFFE